MGKPLIRSGRFTAGADLQCGENVVIAVAEEMRVGDRCVLPDNAYFGGRRVEIGDDFYGYSWGHPAPAYVHARTPENEHGTLGGDLMPFGCWLEIGRGRQDEEDAILTVGDRCTFHDVRIDLARMVVIGDDVGLSPEVVIYTHHYWLSCLDGYPCKYAPVGIDSGVIIGFRSVVLPGAVIGAKSVVGAQAVVTGHLDRNGVYAGNPARKVRDVVRPGLDERNAMLGGVAVEYARSCDYRGLKRSDLFLDYPLVVYRSCRFDVERQTVEGTEDEYTDDLRWHLFTRGIRIYTKRPFRKLGKRP